jgi:hypothetical protein
MKLAAAKILSDAHKALKDVERAADGAESIPLSYVKKSPLRSLAQSVSPDAAAWGEIQVPNLRRALQSITTEVNQLGLDEKGEMSERTQGSLSPMAARFLGNSAGVDPNVIEAHSIDADMIQQMQKQLASLRGLYNKRSDWNWSLERIDLHHIKDPLRRLVDMGRLVRAHSPTGMWTTHVVDYEALKNALKIFSSNIGNPERALVQLSHAPSRGGRTG